MQTSLVHTYFTLSPIENSSSYLKGRNSSKLEAEFDKK